MLSQLGKRGERNLGGKARSPRTPDPGEGMHNESEAVNMSHEMSACRFPYKETPAGAEKPVITSTHRDWERAGARQLWSRVRMGTARRKVAGGLGGPDQGDLLRAHLFPCLFPPCCAPGDTEGTCEHLVGVAHGSLGKQLCMMKE